MTSAIRIEDVRKTYPKAWRRPAKEALKGISLSVDVGETFGFIGPNGAGKSTLIKILVGVLKPTAGTVSIFDRDVTNPASRQGLGFVPENPSLLDFLTPREILLMGLRLHGVKVDDEKQYCMDWLERFDLGAVADSPLRGFSKGMMQRTALAHALALKPRLLILDEPLSGLDPVGRKDVVDILDEYRRSGGSLFFSSHVLHDVERLADRFGLIHKGELLTLRSPADLVGGEQVYMVRSAGQREVPGMHHEAAGRWFGEVSAQGLWQHLDSLKLAGHQLVEVKPTLSLESAFMRYLGLETGAKRP